MNLPGREGYLAPIQSEEVPEAKKKISKDHSWRFAKVGGIMGSQNLHASNLFGRLAFFFNLFHLTIKSMCLEFARCNWNFDWNWVLLSDKTKIEFFHNKK